MLRCRNRRTKSRIPRSASSPGHTFQLLSFAGEIASRSSLFAAPARQEKDQSQCLHWGETLAGSEKNTNRPQELENERMKFKMRVRCESRLSAICALAACSIAIAGATMATAQQSAAPASTAPVSLQPYTAPDKSASAGVPAGWKVTAGAFGVIQMSGPQGEEISLGSHVLFMDGPSKPQTANPITMMVPYQAPLAQKYAVLISSSPYWPETTPNGSKSIQPRRFHWAMSLNAESSWACRTI